MKLFPEKNADRTPPKSDELGRLIRTYNRNVRWLVGTIGVTIAIHIIGAIICEKFSQSERGAELFLATPNWAYWLTLVVLIAELGLYTVLTRKPRENKLKLVKEIIDLNDLGALNTLISAAQSLVVLPGFNEMTVDALNRLLFRIKEQDAHYITKRSRYSLRGILEGVGQVTPVSESAPKTKRDAYEARIRRNTDMKLAILNAFKHIGDSREIAAVTRVTKLKAKTEYDREIVAAATECLAAIQARLDAAKDINNLLRPSSSDDNARLLRPAVGAGDEDKEQLLRPSGVEDELGRKQQENSDEYRIDR